MVSAKVRRNQLSYAVSWGTCFYVTKRNHSSKHARDPKLPQMDWLALASRHKYFQLRNDEVFLSPELFGTFLGGSPNIILKYYKLIDMLNGKNENLKDFYYSFYRETLSFKN